MISHKQPSSATVLDAKFWKGVMRRIDKCVIDIQLILDGSGFICNGSESIFLNSPGQEHLRMVNRLKCDQI
jgi:hypothetical protein